MVAVGLWGAQLGAPAIWLLPVAFPMVMAFGGLLGLMGVPLPGIEIGIAALGHPARRAVMARRARRSSARRRSSASSRSSTATRTAPSCRRGRAALLYSIGFVVATGCLHALGHRDRHDPPLAGWGESRCVSRARGVAAGRRRLSLEGGRVSRRRRAWRPGALLLVRRADAHLNRPASGPSTTGSRTSSRRPEDLVPVARARAARRPARRARRAPRALRAAGRVARRRARWASQRRARRPRCVPAVSFLVLGVLVAADAKLPGRRGRGARRRPRPRPRLPERPRAARGPARRARRSSGSPPRVRPRRARGGPRRRAEAPAGRASPCAWPEAGSPRSACFSSAGLHVRSEQASLDCDQSIVRMGRSAVI